MTSHPSFPADGFPAKAVVGEIVPVRATVWREGHDAVSATLVVRYHGTAYPRLAEDPPGRATTAPAGADRGRGHARAAQVSRSCCRWRRAGHPMCSTASSRPDRVGLWTFRVDGWGDPIATWRKNVTAKLDAGQSEGELSNDLLVGAQLLERAATGVPRQDRYPLIDAAAAAARAG